MELIDRFELMKKACEARKFDKEMLVVGLGYVINAHKIDAEPLTRSHKFTNWLGDTYCSNCNRSIDCTSNYCNWCGAKLDKEDINDE